MADPLTLLTNLVSPLKAAKDIAVGLNKLNTLTEVNAKAIELQGVILELQSTAFELQAAYAQSQERIRELESKLARGDEWKLTQARYKMVSAWTGSSVYVLRKSHQAEETPHFLCANCFNNRKLSILVPKRDASHYYSYDCPSCRASIVTGFRGPSQAKFAEDYAEK